MSKRPTRPKGRQTKPVRKSTALARRAPASLARVTVLPPAPREKPQLAVAVLTEDVAIGMLGTVELKLTAAEERELATPVPIAEVLLKPDDGIVYLPHASYTRWFNRAFGRLGWALVPLAKPMKSEKHVVCPYMLHVHGKPVAFAYGEQEYFDSNRKQTYGDALEATFASAIRRCAKRLGVGLELWDRAWGERFREEHGVLVQTPKGRMWRRKDGPPLPGEDAIRGGRRGGKDAERVDHGTGEVVDADVREERPAYRHAAENDPISEPQRKRLWAIVTNSGRNEEHVKEWLRAMGFESSKLIPRARYDWICNMITADGPLPAKR